MDGTFVVRANNNFTALAGVLELPTPLPVETFSRLYIDNDSFELHPGFDRVRDFQKEVNNHCAMPAGACSFNELAMASIWNGQHCLLRALNDPLCLNRNIYLFLFVDKTSSIPQFKTEHVYTIKNSVADLAGAVDRTQDFMGETLAQMLTEKMEFCLTPEEEPYVLHSTLSLPVQEALSLYHEYEVANINTPLTGIALQSFERLRELMRRYGLISFGQSLLEVDPAYRAYLTAATQDPDYRKHKGLYPASLAQSRETNLDRLVKDILETNGRY